MSKSEYVYSFKEAAEAGLDVSMLGGKGYSLVQMTRMGLPVPPGFIVTTDTFRKLSSTTRWDTIKNAVTEHVTELENVSGKLFGHPTNSLLVSVRSGAPISMPGMMDTILNVGLPRADFMAGGIGGKNPLYPFQSILRKYLTDGMSKAGYPASASYENAPDQLALAFSAVWRSYNSERAKLYRKTQGIPDSTGTAIVVQQMVFGVMPGRSGTGILFSRDPSSGEKIPLGEVAFNAQGDLIVGGGVTPEPLPEDEVWVSDLYNYASKLEVLYKDAVDVEFTLEDGKLYLLQCRALKSEPQATRQIVSDLQAEGVITAEEAEAKLTELSVDEVKQQANVPGRNVKLPPSLSLVSLAKGLPVTTGFAVGVWASPEEAVMYKDAGTPYILWATMTEPKDLPVMLDAAGIVTATGGATCHAAIVARKLGIPCVVGTNLLLANAKKTGYKSVVVDGKAGCVSVITSGSWQDVIQYNEKETA